jgi:hypothetical protein
MDPVVLSLAADLRKHALSQAAHDFKGNGRDQEVVARAETYYAFLCKALPLPPEAPR